MTDIEIKRVTGMDEALRKKAEELIEIGPDEPRSMREGTLFFNWKDYWCISHNDGFGFWACESIDGQSIPQKLEGRFTSKQKVMDAIDRYGDPEQQERGRAILERKEIQLQRDIKAGTRDNVAHERKKIPARALRESLIKKKRNIDPAKDTPTVME